MNTSSKMIALALFATLAGCGGLKKVTPGLAQNDDGKVAELEAQLQAIKDREAADEKLGQFAINMMYKAGSGRTLSDGKKLILARAIVRVANDVFDITEERRGFVVVLAIESGFNRFAQSPTGPKGYGQLAKSSFHEAMASCGVSNVHDEDVWETDLNLYAAACYFKKMLADNEGDPLSAIVAYNQGPNSKALKEYKRQGTTDNIEALKYMSKFNFLNNKVTDKPTEGVPHISSLPSPSGKAVATQPESAAPAVETDSE